MEAIQLPGHEHSLVRDTRSLKGNCQLCSKRLRSDRNYVFSCEKCNYYFHYSCLVPFLQQINHPSHPDHLLSMSRYPFQSKGPQYMCGVCGKFYLLDDIPSYKCAMCNFQIDMFCALSIPTVIYENKQNYPPLCHRQPMRLVEINHDEEDQVPIKCCICELPLSNPAYTCEICHHFFHRSCTQLSSKIRHPFHLRHLLILKLGGVGIKCHSCHKTCLNFVFHCSSVRCQCYMCVECTFPRLPIRSTIIYQGHDHHLLSLMEKQLLHEKITCNSPYSYCKQYPIVPNELTHTESYIFCCQSCNFSLHFLCGPLPCVIKHNCHIHPLTLLDSIVEDDSGEYYCDACETERDPRICVYCCSECKYIAHVSCVISEVVRVLQGDCRDVELRAVGQMNQKLKSIEKEDKEAKPTTLLHLFILVRKALTKEKGFSVILRVKVEEEEAEEIDFLELQEKCDYLDVLNTMASLIDGKRNVLVERIITKGGHKKRRQIGETSIQELISSSYSDKNFEELVQKLNNSDYGMKWCKVTPDELKMKIVEVEGGYMIPWNLACVMKDVVDKFGDISGDQNKSSSKELTSILFFFLCRLVYNMSRVMVVDVTEDVLGDWYSYFKFLKSRGFKVDFLNSGLEQIVRAYFGLQARRAENAIKATRHETILKLREEIEELEDKLKKCKEDLDSYEGHERSTERLRRDTSSNSETTILMKQCLDEASKLEWKNAADCLDLMQ